MCHVNLERWYEPQSPETFRYPLKTARNQFLRGKWSSNEDEIKTAADFIAKAATDSGTTGKPYLIKLKDGAEVKCADFLTDELKKLETK